MPIGMKKIIIGISILVYSNVGVSQKRNDLIDFKKINLKFLDSLIFEEAMKERKKVNLSRMVHDDNCSKTAKYQAEYCSNYNELTHVNNKPYLGSLLKEPNNRFEFYVNKSKSKLKYKVNMEIIMQYKNINTTNYTNLISKTYEDCAKSIIMSFMSSESHKESVIFEMDEFGKMHGEYKSYYNSKTDCLTTTGFFVLVFGNHYISKNNLLFSDF